MEDVPSTGSLEALRHRNRQRVVGALARTGLASRADLARSTGLSRTTVSSLVGELLEAGIVVEREDVPGTSPTPGGGRPPVLLGLDRSAGAAIGLDLGHSHIRAAVADLAHTVVVDQTVELDVDALGLDALDHICDLVEDSIDKSGFSRDAIIGLGIGLAGPVRLGTRTLGSSTILPGWQDVPIAETLEDRLGINVLADNDANLGALAELSFGAAQGEQFVAYIRAYSGIGAGLIADGRLYRGAGGTAGELGHVIVDEHGPVCRCGNRGCLETVAAEGAILELLRRTHGPDITMPEVLQRAADGDAACRRVIADAGHHIGVATANLVNIFNPGMVVVGGSLAGAGDVLLGPMRDAVDRYAISSAASDVRIVAGVLGERAEVLGALALVFAEAEGVLPIRVAARGAA